MYFVIYSDGQISTQEISSDCQKNSWIPITTIEYKSGDKTIPCFYDANSAKTFAVRNFPKNWLKGIVFLEQEDLIDILSNGYKIDKFSFPKLFKDRQDCVLNFVILDFKTTPDLYYLGL